MAALLFYPTNEPINKQNFGPFELSVAMNAEIRPGQYPLVIISHGNGGSPWPYRHLAGHLAANGYIVVIPKHPGNNHNDNHLGGTEELLTSRPSDIEQIIKYAKQDSNLQNHIKKNNTVLIGHSLGGFTVLAAASKLKCSGIKAIVLLAPATVFLKDDDALENITCPVLMFIGEKDELTGPCCPKLAASGHKADFMPHGYHAHIVSCGIKDKSLLQIELVKNAGHFSFMTPFPASMKKTDFPPSQDPEGFDREAYQVMLHDRISTFLTATENTRTGHE